MPPRARTWQRWAVINLVEIAIILAGAEVLWRVLVPDSETERRAAEVVQTSLGFLQPCATIENRSGASVLVGLQPEYTGGDFVYPVEKSPGTIRIAVVGESTGAMLAAALYELSVEDPRAQQIQVLNCASAGAALEHVERRAREVLRYAPDVMIVAFGHNLMMRYRMGERLLRFQSLLYRSRLAAGIVTHAADRRAGERPDQGERLGRLEAWLRQLARDTRRRGITLMLTTVAANLWYPPGDAVDDVSEPRFLAATLAYAEGRTERAIETLSTLVAQRPEAYWQFTLGTWLARHGESHAAATHLQAAIDSEARDPDRAPSAVNQLVRRVAHEEALLLRDTEEEMRAVSRDGLPGWDVLRDHCHLLPRYFRSEASAVLGLVRSALGQGASAAKSSLSGAEPDTIGWILNGLTSNQAARDDAMAYRHQRAIAFFVEHWARTRPEDTAAAVDAFVDGPTFAGVKTPARRAALLSSIADGYWWAGLSERALAMNERARREAVDGPWVQLGLFRLSTGDQRAAADAFRRALDLTADRRDVAIFLAGLADGQPP